MIPLPEQLTSSAHEHFGGAVKSKHVLINFNFKTVKLLFILNTHTVLLFIVKTTIMTIIYNRT
jgi:hypothetical protein